MASGAADEGATLAVGFLYGFVGLFWLPVAVFYTLLTPRLLGSAPALVLPGFAIINTLWSLVAAYGLLRFRTWGSSVALTYNAVWFALLLFEPARGMFQGRRFVIQPVAGFVIWLALLVGLSVLTVLLFKNRAVVRASQSTS